jgi:hypothetical protein
MSSAAWVRGAAIASMGSENRRTLLNLEHPDPRPILLQGAAIVIYDCIDGERDTNAIITDLSGRYPDVGDMDSQVRSCLAELEATGIISLASPAPEDATTPGESPDMVNR